MVSRSRCLSQSPCISITTYELSHTAFCQQSVKAIPVENIFMSQNAFECCHFEHGRLFLEVDVKMMSQEIVTFTFMTRNNKSNSF